MIPTVGDQIDRWLTKFGHETRVFL
jgi:hypothetical protein